MTSHRRAFCAAKSIVHFVKLSSVALVSINRHSLVPFHILPCIHLLNQPAHIPPPPPPLPPFLYFFKASFGNPPNPSCPSLPTPCGSEESFPNVSPSVLALLSLVAGSRISPPYETSLSTPPDPTFTLLPSLEFQSEATGGSSGRGRLDWRSAMISDLGLEFRSTMDWWVGGCSQWGWDDARW